MQAVEHLGAEIFKPPGSVRKGLFETVPADINMADDLSFIRSERTFAFRVQWLQRVDVDHRIGLSLGDGIPEKLENIVFPPMMCRVARPGDRIPRLPEGRKTETTTADGRYQPYHEHLPQAEKGSNLLMRIGINAPI